MFFICIRLMQMNMPISSYRPNGRFAYAFNNHLLVTYDLATDQVVSQSGNSTWLDTSFIPYVADTTTDQLIVVSGYVGSPSSKFIPCTYLLTLLGSKLMVLDTWLYTPPSNSSWQASLTNWDADVYLPKYDMSVSIRDPEGKVLLGIPVVNTIFILTIDRATKKFLSASQSLSNGKAMGMGKSVAWLGANLTLVLVNTYSLSYVWSSSQLFMYDVSVPNTFAIDAILPNVQQPLAPSFGPTLISFVATGNGTVIMLDSNDSFYILVPSASGYFSDTSNGWSSAPSPCVPGTFTATLDILPCSLCPQGKTTNGLSGQFMCALCETDAFCPPGAAFGNVSLSLPLFKSVNQAHAYPLSPQSTRFDNILMQNMFVIHSSASSHCLTVSPLFWALIATAVGVCIWIVMVVVKHHVRNARSQQIRNGIKHLIKKTDLVGEGELVAGGLASFAIIVLAAFAFSFSNSYYYRYPIESLAGNATFTCDPTISNAQFTSGLMPLGIPHNAREAPIFEMLNAQPFTLHIDLINTLFTCTDVTLVQIKDRIVPLTIQSCNMSTDSLSISAALPSHSVSLQLLLNGANTIGGLRLGLEGPGASNESHELEGIYSLMNLTSFETFWDPARLLTRAPSLTCYLTKLVNHTYGLSEHEPLHFSGLWLPSWSVSVYDTFMDESEYNYAASSSSVVTMSISETPYYTVNTQKPITDFADLILTNILFTIVCLEIFGLAFLIFKLIALPLLKRLILFGQQRLGRTSPTNKSDPRLETF